MKKIILVNVLSVLLIASSASAAKYENKKDLAKDPGDLVGAKIVAINYDVQPLRDPGDLVGA